ncbi:MAG TPA: GerMN domain-containing protein [Patescibacteria group bacterium]|nr:GerMN domain-containing protein [Patescibacteria group bacterium]
MTRESAAADDAGRLAEAMRALLAGPTQADQAEGFVSWFSAATREHLRRVVIRADGTAVVDFVGFSNIIPNASTSAGMFRLLSEIRATAFQFDRVTSLELRFDGSCDAFWTWLGAGKCQMLLRGAALPELPAATP